jgi:hypothetical protein
LKLQQAGLGYASGQFNINDALAEANKKLGKLSTAKQKDAMLTKMFGAENISTGRILLSNIDLYDKFTKGVTGTGIAQEQASINSNTLTVAIEELKAAWINVITSSNQAGSALESVKTIVQFLTRNLDTIVSVGSKILIFFLAWKTLLVLTRYSLIAYNVVLGISAALSGTASIAIGKNAIALGAYKAVLALATAGQWLLNAAMMANPIGLIIIAIVALIAIVVVMIKYWNEWGAVLAVVIGPIGILVSIIQSFRRNWDMIVQAFKDNGILAGIKAIGVTILDSVLMPLQQILSIIAKITGADWAINAVKSIESFRSKAGANVETDESGKPLPGKQVIDPRETFLQRMQTENIQKQNVKIDINDKTGGNASVSSDNNYVPIRLSSTMAFK